MNGLKTGYFCLFILFAFYTGAQEPSYITYTTQDGLAQNQIVAFYQDSDGYIWVGTKSGLSRFDGREFTNFYEKDGLPSNFITNIQEDDQGRIWVLTRSGFAMFDGHKFTPYPVEEGEIFIKWSFSHDRTHVLKDNWIFLTDGNYNPLLFKNGKYYPADTLYPGIEEFNIYRICFNADFTNFIVTVYPEHDLYRYDDGLMTPLTKQQKNESFLFFHNKERARLYIINYDGTWMTFDANTLELIKTKKIQLNQGDRIRHIKNETYLISDKYPFTNKLTIWNKGQINEFDFQVPEFNNIFFDRENNIWIASESGLIKIISTKFKNHFYFESTPTYPWSVIEDPHNNNIFIGSYKDGLFLFDGKHFEKVHVKNLPDLDNNNLFYYNAFHDSKGNIWVPHTNGVVKITDGEAKHINPMRNKENLAGTEHSPTGKIILAFHNYLVFLKNDKTVRIDTLYPGDKRGIILELTEDKYNNIWAGNNVGISIWNGQNYIHLPNDTIPFNLGANTITKDHKGNIWIGNRKGLFFYDYKGKIRKIEHPAFQQFVKSLSVVDSTGLFAGMIGEIAYMDLQAFYQRDTLVVDSYDEHNGFMGMEVVQNGSYAASDGTVWMGTNIGVINFSPQTKEERYFTATEPIITGMQVQTGEGEWETIYQRKFMRDNHAELLLNRKQNNIRFEFAGLTMIQPEKVRYRYKIEGLDEHWSNPVKERYAHYTYLQPGEYQFMVDMTNPDGEWNNAPVSFAFTLQKAWWQKSAFQIISVVIFLSLFAAAVERIIHARKKHLWVQMNRQKKIAELRLDAARAQTNPHFIFNVLNSIGSSVVTGDRMESYGVLTKFSKLIRRMFENHEHPCWSLKDEVRFLTDYLDLQKQRFKDYFDYRIDLQNNISEETLIPRLFLQTLAENALKHGILPSGGKKNIITRIYKEESRTIITMENDGLPRKALDTKLNPSSENGNSRSNGREHEDDSTGKGLSIAQQLFDIFNLYNKEKIHFDIEDLMDDTGHPAGVRVRVSIPDNYNYRVFDTSANQVRN